MRLTPISCFLGALVCTALIAGNPSPSVAGDCAARSKLQSGMRSWPRDCYTTAFLMNRVFNYYRNDGSGCTNPFSGSDEGFEFPKGSGKTLVFNDGIIWGGIFNGEAVPRIGGSCYTGLFPGRIVEPGTSTTPLVAEQWNGPANRIYKIRRNVHQPLPYTEKMAARIDSTELTYLSRYQTVTAESIYAQYCWDWANWPVQSGAPFIDQDGNGSYDWGSDFPCAYGAVQELWYVANDLDTTGTHNVWGCPPIGIEVQKTIWGYDAPGALGNTIFVRTRLINKSGSTIQNMVVSQWVDPDVGGSLDDFVGCDTTLDLSFAYNGGATDAMYGTAVPAVGYLLLQGPIVPGSAGDTALFDMQYRTGVQNLGMTAFMGTECGLSDFTCPYFDQPMQWYGAMLGLLPLGGAMHEYDDPSRPVTTFAFSGDPATSAGWNEPVGMGHPGDRYMIMSTGPFTMAPGDTQEVVIANIAGDGQDRLSSVTVLKDYARQVRTFYRSLASIATGIGRDPFGLPEVVNLDQNYPNPFNPSTTIMYSIPDVGSQHAVTLQVFDVLGRLVATLVNERKAPGEHTVRFDAAGLSSGVYFYRLTVGSFVQTRSMLLVR